METLTQILSSAIESEKLNKIIFSGKRKKSIEYSKVTVRPITLKGEYMYQAEYHFDKKVTHKNIPYYETVDFALDKYRFQTDQHTYGRRRHTDPCFKTR